MGNKTTNKLVKHGKEIAFLMLNECYTVCTFEFGKWNMNISNCIPVEYATKMFQWFHTNSTSCYMTYQDIIDGINKALEENPSVTVPISEGDVEMMKDLVHNNDSGKFKWTIKDNNGIEIDITFVEEMTCSKCGNHTENGYLIDNDYVCEWCVNEDVKIEMKWCEVVEVKDSEHVQ